MVVGITLVWNSCGGNSNFSGKLRDHLCSIPMTVTLLLNCFDNIRATKVNSEEIYV